MTRSSTEQDRLGVLFDMDGVIAATEPLKAIAHTKTCAYFGGDVDENLYRMVIGQSFSVVRDAFLNKAKITVADEDYLKVFRAEYSTLLDQRLSEMPGITELVKGLHRRGYLLVAVSSSERWMIDEILGRLGLQAYFHSSISSEDIKAEKPFPDPYVKALAGAGLMPAQALVIEDTETGIQSAKAAGLRVIALRHDYNVRHQFSDANTVLSSLTDTDAVLSLIARLLGGG